MAKAGMWQRFQLFKASICILCKLFEETNAHPRSQGQRLTPQLSLVPAVLFIAGLMACKS